MIEKPHSPVCEHASRANCPKIFGDTTWMPPKGLRVRALGFEPGGYLPVLRLMRPRRRRPESKSNLRDDSGADRSSNVATLPYNRDSKHKVEVRHPTIYRHYAPLSPGNSHSAQQAASCVEELRSSATTTAPIPSASAAIVLDLISEMMHIDHYLADTRSHKSQVATRRSIDGRQLLYHGFRQKRSEPCPESGRKYHSFYHVLLLKRGITEGKAAFITLWRQWHESWGSSKGGCSSRACRPLLLLSGRLANSVRWLNRASRAMSL